MTADRKIVLFNDADMPPEWLDFYQTLYPEAEFRRSNLVERGKAYVLDPRFLYPPLDSYED